MTVTDLTTHVRRRERTTTPESQRVAELEAMLTDPLYAGYHTELQAARDELLQLTATSVLAA